MLRDESHRPVIVWLPVRIVDLHRIGHALIRLQERDRSNCFPATTCNITGLISPESAIWEIHLKLKRTRTRPDRKDAFEELVIRIRVYTLSDHSPIAIRPIWTLPPRRKRNRSDDRAFVLQNKRRARG